MVIANARTGYKVRIKKAKLSSIATLLESFNTHGKKSSLTTNLDSLSDAALEKAMKQIKGMTIQKSLGQGIRSNNNFKRATDACSAGSQKLEQPMTIDEAKKFCEDKIKNNK